MRCVNVMQCGVVVDWLANRCGVDYWSYAIVPLAGALAGFINAMAGSGSLLTLPALMVAGLDSGVANGANRIGILLQSATSFATYWRKGVRGFLPIMPLALPAMLGGIGGALFAVRVPSEVLDRVIGVLLLAMVGLMFFDSSRWKGEARPVDCAMLRRPWLWVAFVGIGFYGGFIQVGSNFFILLALIYLGGMDLLHANAFKLLVQLAFTVVVLPIYIYHGRVHWPLALLLSAGSMLGAWIGVNVAVRGGGKLIRWVIIAVVSLFAVRLLLWS